MLLYYLIRKKTGITSKVKLLDRINYLIEI